MGGTRCHFELFNWSGSGARESRCGHCEGVGSEIAAFKNRFLQVRVIFILGTLVLRPPVTSCTVLRALEHSLDSSRGRFTGPEVPGGWPQEHVRRTAPSCANCEQSIFGKDS